jgi:hypothetical protein
MCNFYSGHIVTSNDENFGKVLFFSGLHHEKDRELPEVAKHGSNLLAWETRTEGSFKDGVKMTHDCGQQLSADRIKALLDLVKEWGENQSFEFLTKNLSSGESYRFYLECKPTKEERALLVPRITESDAYLFCLYCKPTKAERALLVPRITESGDIYWFCQECKPTKSERALLVSRITESGYVYLFCLNGKPTKAERALLVPRITENGYALLFSKHCNPTEEEKKILEKVLKMT